MKLQFEFDRVKSSGDIKGKISKKFAALEKYLNHVKDDFHQGLIRVIKGDRFGYKVKVDVELPGKRMIAEGTGKTILNAIDEAYDNTARMIRKYLERLKDKKH